MLELIRTLYRYEQWATARIRETAERVPFDRLTSPVLPGFDPIRSALLHTVWAQELWLRRWQGRPPIPMLEPDAFPDLASIRAHWHAIDDETDRFLAALTDDQLAAPVTYAGMQGGSFTYPLWQLMLHQANHATYHRGEIAAVLTALGASPGELDVLRMFDGRR